MANGAASGPGGARDGDAPCGGAPGGDGSSSHGAPAPVLPALAGPLGDVDVDSLSFGEAARVLHAAGQLASWLGAFTAKVTVRLAETSPSVVPTQDPAGPNRSEEGLARMCTEAEVAGALCVDESEAQRLIGASTQLVEEFPATLAGLEAGALNPKQAAAIIGQGQSVPEHGRQAFEAELLDAAGRSQMPGPKLAGRARRLRERMHPESRKRRREKSVADRRAYFQPAEDGMAWFGAYLPAEAAVAAYNRITAAARALQGPDEARTLPQLRADITADLLLAAGFIPDTDNDSGAMNAGSSAHGSDTGGAGVAPDGGAVPERPMPHFEHIKAEVFVTVPVLTLLGLSDEPAELEGFGPVDDDTARKLCAGASSFKRILTHPETGAMISFGRDTYKVPADLKRMINIRDRCCRTPGCNRSARTCDLDHTVPWSEAGSTDYDNLKNGCERHHLLKHACGWDDKQKPGGVIEWTSPAGLTYKSEPEGPVLTSRNDAGRYKTTGHGHHFDPWDPDNTPPPTTDADAGEPPPF